MHSSSTSSDAVGTLYVQHGAWLLSWLQGKLGDSHTAADLTHDTFVSLIKTQLGNKGLSLHEPRAYLTTVAKGLLVNRRRRLELEQAWLDTLAVLPTDVAMSPEEEIIIHEALLELDRLFDAMAPAVRSVFLHAQIDGLSYAEIAAHLGISLRTVKRHMAQAFELCLVLLP